MHALVIEIFIILLYIFTFYCAKKISLVRFLVYATLFAAIFENVNVLLFKGMEGGYTYSADFNLFVFHTPLFVILSWGIILLGSYVLAQGLGCNKLQRLFFVPLSVLVIDFVLEGMSVMQHYWTWQGFAYGGLLGSISPGNFIGWLGVAFGFVFVYDYFSWKWLSIFLGYIGFLLIAALAQTFSIIFSWEGMQGYYSFLIIFIGFLLAHFLTIRKQQAKTFNQWHYILLTTRTPFFIAGFLLHYKAGFFFDWALAGFVTFAILFDMFHTYILFLRQPPLQKFVKKIEKNYKNYL